MRSWRRTPAARAPCAPPGQACATNPIAVIGPCHRVLGTNGLGGYGGGLDQKCTLLALEGALLVA